MGELEERRVGVVSKGALNDIQLPSTQHSLGHEHGVEICVWPGAQGVAVFVLPDQRAQRAREVCDFGSCHDAAMRPAEGRLGRQ